MKDRINTEKSSISVTLPFIAGLFLLAIICAFFSYIKISICALIVLFICLLARLWSQISARNVEIKITSDKYYLFPDDSMNVKITVKNNKFFPVVWMQLIFPLSEKLCLIPSDTRLLDDAEMREFKGMKASTEIVGEKRLSYFSWYEEQIYTSLWSSKRRGIYSTDSWRAVTGDGFGLAQRDILIPKIQDKVFAVFPKIVDVNAGYFLQRMWSGESAGHGNIQDRSIIASSRDYMPGDSAKDINWRLTARGLPLTVNCFEKIQPRSIHFVFDGESFTDKLEDALSIIASIINCLIQNNIECGISFPAGEREADDVFCSKDSEKIFYLMASYDLSNNQELASFNERKILEESFSVAKYYYIYYEKNMHPDLIYNLSNYAICEALSYKELVKFKNEK